MKRRICFLCFSISLIFIIESSYGNELKPDWHTSASYKLRLSVWDKYSVNQNYKVKYIVKTSQNLTFVAERDGVARDGRSAEVLFPDDFVIQETGKKAWIDSDGKECIWEIYVNNILEDSGTISFVRTTIRIEK